MSLPVPGAMERLFEVVHEDADLLVINKPAGLVCHPTKADLRSSLVGRLRIYLGSMVQFHLVNRLDRETSGLVVVAKSGSAARELRRIWESGGVRKRYLAIVRGHVLPESGVVRDPIGPDPFSAVAIKDRVCPEGKNAATRFHVRHRFKRDGRAYTAVEVEPITGRKHQIRIHLAAAGAPIVGDKIYGGDEKIYLRFVEGCLTEMDKKVLEFENHALHAWRLRWTWLGVEREMVAEIPQAMKGFCREFSAD